MRKQLFFRIFIAGAALILAGARARAATDSLGDALYHLGAGAVLKTRNDIRIMANEAAIPLPSPADSQILCKLEMIQSSPKERVLPRERELVVTKATHSAMTYRGKIFAFTHIWLKSNAIEQISCTRKSGWPDPTIGDFLSAIRPHFSLSYPIARDEVN